MFAKHKIILLWPKWQLTQWPNTQTIRWQEPKTCLSEFDHYVGLALTGLTIDSTKKIFLRFF